MLTSIYNDELNDSKILTHVLFKENLYLKIKYYNFIYLIRNPESLKLGERNLKLKFCFSVRYTDK